MIDMRDLTKRERLLIAVLGLMLVLMFFSRQPDMVGVELALAMAWTAFLLFFVMLGVLVFVKDDTMEKLTAKSAKQAAANAAERAKARPKRSAAGAGRYDDGLD